MSREIKFRAWDTRLKEWLGAPEWSIKPDGLVLTTLADRDIVLRSVIVNHVQLMQYTGLKDKNGVEIYEGDVVSYLGGSGETFNKRAVWDNDNSRFALEPLNYGGASEPLIWATKAEVIGNVFESPELLTKEGNK